MHQRIGVLVLLSAACGAGGCEAESREWTVPAQDTPVTVRLEPVATGLAQPTALVAPPDATKRLFVVDRVGVVRVLSPDGQLSQRPFLDLSAKIGTTTDGRGLHGLAFHPRFATNGRFFVSYTAPQNPAVPNVALSTHLSEFRVSLKDPNLSVPQTERTLIAVDQPRLDPSSGTIAFGPEGDLYFAVAGANGDGANPRDLRGKVLRVDVDHGDAYAIPADNPYAKEGGRPEIYSTGLRAPGAFTFDLAGTRELFAVDGQRDLGLLSRGGLGTPEVYQLGPRSSGVAIVGGALYRGALVPEMRGRFLFSVAATATESSTSRLCLASRHEGSPWTIVEVRIANSPNGLPQQLIRGFGQDLHGELFLVATAQGGPVGASGMVLSVQPLHGVPTIDASVARDAGAPASPKDLAAPRAATPPTAGLDATIQ
jgi:hypothetical protein